MPGLFCISFIYVYGTEWLLIKKSKTCLPSRLTIADVKVNKKLSVIGNRCRDCKSYHCLEYARIRVFTDSYSLV